MRTHEPTDNRPQDMTINVPANWGPPPLPAGWGNPPCPQPTDEFPVRNAADMRVLPCVPRIMALFACFFLAIPETQAQTCKSRGCRVVTAWVAPMPSPVKLDCQPCRCGNSCDCDGSEKCLQTKEPPLFRTAAQVVIPAVPVAPVQPVIPVAPVVPIVPVVPVSPVVVAPIPVIPAAPGSLVFVRRPWFPGYYLFGASRYRVYQVPYVAVPVAPVVPVMPGVK